MYLRKRYGHIGTHLAGKSYLFGEQFSVAYAYLFTVTNWAGFVKLDLSDLSNLTAFQARVAARPAVQAAMAAERAPHRTWHPRPGLEVEPVINSWS